MNIAFFLLPKKDVIYLTINNTLRQALEKMEYHRYSAIPLIDEKGRYAATITEGDLLWKLKSMPNFNLSSTEKILLRDIPLQVENEPVKIGAQIQDLLSLAVSQNFVPVVDDEGIFIGLVRRSDIIEYCLKILQGNKLTSE